MNFYYQLDDQIWGFTEGGWVAAVPEGCALDAVPDLETLRARIRFYGGALGELATIEDLRPGPDYDLSGEEWVRVRFSKKEFLLWCGMEQIVKLNAARQKNPTAETVYTLLMASEFIDVTDPATVQMLQLLATEAVGSILTAENVNRILAGEQYETKT